MITNQTEFTLYAIQFKWMINHQYVPLNPFLLYESNVFNILTYYNI